MPWRDVGLCGSRESESQTVELLLSGLQSLDVSSRIAVYGVSLTCYMTGDGKRESPYRTVGRRDGDASAHCPLALPLTRLTTPPGPPKKLCPTFFFLTEMCRSV